MTKKEYLSGKKFMIAGLTQVFLYDKKEDKLSVFSNFDGSISIHPVALMAGDTEIWINDLRIGEIGQTIFAKLEACKRIE
jgi:hypothetical protein